MREAIIGLIGVILGAAIAGGIGFFQTSYFYHLDVEREVIKERIKLIEEASRVFSLTSKVMAHYGTASTQANAMQQANIVCVDQLMQGKKIDCDFSAINDQIIELSVEVFKAYERFGALKSASSVYFCNSTKQALETLAEGGAWWVPEREAIRSKVLDEMHGELVCANNALQRTSR